ncbi:MAG: flagellar hook basal-body protein [Candidatus Paracaedibacteraceae bacterium]|nr:flagellar hook basal-body protein [Candidatus Paracaedibacteraceae bacterium]
MVLSVPVQRSATVALSLQETLWPQLEATASNLANSTTSGFKRVYAESIEAKYQNQANGNVSYVTLMNLNHDFSPGALKPTGNTYDIAISGDDFFQVEGGRLTQNGQFRLSAEGTIVGPSGEALLSTGGGPITIPIDSNFVHISPTGAVSNQNGVIDTIGVFTVADKKTLQYTKDGYYLPTDELIVSESATVHQGYIMESNVNPIEETVKLIEIQRRYEQAEKLLKESYSLASNVIHISSKSGL